MSTALDHRLVREYLRQLDAALVGLPAAHARELREQIAAHLDELLSPDAGDEEVAAALSRVGDPAELAAEAAPESPAGALGRTRRTLRARLAGLGWRRWLLIGTSGLLVVVAVAYYIAVQAAPELTCGRGAASGERRRDRSQRASAPGPRRLDHQNRDHRPRRRLVSGRAQSRALPLGGRSERPPRSLNNPPRDR
jgi:hypothetical protein